MIKKNIVIIYHGDCKDGFGGAWTAWKKFGDDAAYIPVFYNEPIPEGLKNKEIYLLDFCYAEKEIRGLMAINKRVTVIDHHVSREMVTKMTQDFSYALDHSGAVLAWKYFHPKKEVPQLLLHIEDGDLWKFTVPHTKEISAVLESFGKEFNLWTKIARQLENKTQREALIKQGKALLQYKDELIRKIIDQYGSITEFEGFKTFVVNSPLFKSEIGNQLAKSLPPIGIVWNEKNGERIVSLRSIGEVDVQLLAKKYGGGGHKNAAGFSMSMSKPAPWK